MNVAVLTPMAKELDAIRDGLLKAGFDSRAGCAGRLPTTQFPELGLTLAVGGHGKAQFGVQAQHFLDAGPDWSLLICAGAAGALVDRLSVGDIVVGTKTVEHDYIGRFSEDSPVPHFDGDPKALESLRGISVEEYGVFCGPIASGDEDIVEPIRRAEVRDLTSALVVAWEGAGGARACRFSAVPYLEMRGVTDDADQAAPNDFRANLRMAMGNVADLLARWIA